jgi:hypothetical protein
MNRQRPRRGGARRPGTGIAEPIPHNERLRRHGTSLSAANAALGLSRPPPRIIAFEDGLAYIATLPLTWTRDVPDGSFEYLAIFVCALRALRCRKAGNNVANRRKIERTVCQPKF